MTTKEPPITTARWAEIIRRELVGIADRSFQEKAWFNPGPGGPVSSPTEMISMLLDTYDFGNGAQERYLDLTDAQRAACADFDKMLQTFGRGRKKQLIDRQILDDPEWEKIRQAAAELLRILPS
ncbi:MAG TPA: hypothetical protein VHX19_17295 [Stellaceae bacterium]|jgi:hypothetical protein|nr:hypothetical protein [Stellaceae bacterium]